MDPLPVPPPRYEMNDVAYDITMIGNCIQPISKRCTGKLGDPDTSNLTILDLL